jgi:hypothetical protein
VSELCSRARGGETARDDVPRATKRAARTTRVVSRTQRGASQLRLQARGEHSPCYDTSDAKTRETPKRVSVQLRRHARGKETARDDVSRATKRVARTTRVVSRTKRGVSQLRLQARGNTARSGLAGRSLPCKKGFGLALKRSDGEHHHARGGVASKEARGAGVHTPRGGWEPGPIPRLDRDRYCDKRERERERCVSAADASTYGPYWARGNPWHVCPHRTHAKTAPSPKTIQVPLRKEPSIALQGRPQRKTQTRSYVYARLPLSRSHDNQEHSVYNRGCQVRTAPSAQNRPTEPTHAARRSGNGSRGLLARRKGGHRASTERPGIRSNSRALLVATRRP